MPGGAVKTGVLTPPPAHCIKCGHRTEGYLCSNQFTTFSDEVYCILKAAVMYVENGNMVIDRFGTWQRRPTKSLRSTETPWKDT